MIDSKSVMVWGAGIGGGKGVNILAEYAEKEMPDLTAYYFKELVGLIGGPAAVALAWKLQRNGRMTIAKTDAIGLAGVEMFIDRVAKLAQQQFGIGRRGIRRPTGAPPPGRRHPGYSVIATQQRLPFQSDVSW